MTDMTNDVNALLERADMAVQAIHNVEMEGMKIDAETMADFRRFVLNQFDSKTLVERTLKRYGIK